MVGRFEVDACLACPFTSKLQSYEKRHTARGVPFEYLRAQENARHLGNQQANVALPSRRCHPTGSRVPRSHLMGLKAFSGSRKHRSKSYPQLFLSQTLHIYHGTYKHVKFSEIELKCSLGEPQNSQTVFKKLKVAFTVVQEFIREHGSDGRTSLVCKGKELGVYQNENTHSCLLKYASGLFKS